MWFAGWMSVMLNVAFIAGSSKHGKDFRASAACICVVATTLSKPTGLGKSAGEGVPESQFGCILVLSALAGRQPWHSRPAGHRGDR